MTVERDRPEGTAPRRAERHGRIPNVLVDLLALIAAFAIGSLVAGLLGATNLGTALTFGTIAFAATLVALMLLRERSR